MADARYTIGAFASALKEVADSLDNIAGELGRCNLETEVDKTPGRTVICSLPIYMAEMCRAPVRDKFTVAELMETVTALRDWIRDIDSKLSSYDSSTPLDDGLKPPSTTA